MALAPGNSAVTNQPPPTILRVVRRAAVWKNAETELPPPKTVVIVVADHPDIECDADGSIAQQPGEK